jgi:hypothetical protein
MEQSLEHKTISAKAILSAKEAVTIVGRGLGNLIYRFYFGDVQKEDGSWKNEDRESVKGTRNYILGGSIGTHGYTKHLLPLLAKKQFKERCEFDDRDCVDINILVSDIDSANAGAIGAILAFENGGLNLKKYIQKSRNIDKIPTIILIDIGGTKINIVLAQFTDSYIVSYNILNAYIFPTPKDLTAEQFYDILSDNIFSILSIYKNSVF